VRVFVVPSPQSPCWSEGKIAVELVDKGTQVDTGSAEGEEEPETTGSLIWDNTMGSIG